jgi:hypothetical protein
VTTSPVEQNPIAVMSSPSSGRVAAIVAGVMTAVALVGSLLLPSDLLLSAPSTDMTSEFVAWRAFLADALGSGYLPLWNPFTYAGQPFLTGFEPAVLYPLNLPFLFLPLGPALNFSVLLHLIILGWGMERWAASRGLHPWAAALAGLVVPFTGAVFPHLYAGHLSNLCAMAWAPWIFLGLEAWTRAGGRRWLLLASAAICLQILAGQVQYVFFTAVAAGTQAIVYAVFDLEARWRALPAVLIGYLGAAALAAAQLLPGLTASVDVIRREKLEYVFAATFSFPPENLITALAPSFFGGVQQPVYWGRFYFWEMSLFVGACGLLLMATALLMRGRNQRPASLDLLVAALLLVIALGVNIEPVFKFLYEFAPGLGHFRGWSKFIFPATLFLVLVIATGADVVLRAQAPMRLPARIGVLAGIAAIAAGALLIGRPDAIAGLVRMVAESRESYLPAQIFSQGDFIRLAGTHAGSSLMLAGAILLAAGTTISLIERWPPLRYLVPAILLLEMLGFAQRQVATSRMSDAMSGMLREFVAAHPGDYRVLDLWRPNNGFLLGVPDLWGNNPAVLRRYAEFMTLSQGGDPDRATQYLAIRRIDPLLAILRFRYAFIPSSDGFQMLEAGTAPLPRVLLVNDWQRRDGRNAIFAALRDPTFDPRRTALLESEPEPRPQSGAAGSAALVSASPDMLSIEVDTDQPTLLIITDLYDSDWHVEALPGSVQQSYRLMPADYVLRAVPLTAGHHRLQLVYAPAGFSLGVGISLLAWAVWLLLLVLNRSVSVRRRSAANA